MKTIERLPVERLLILCVSIALVENGQRNEGIQFLQNAARRFPENAAIRQALEAYRSQ